MSTKARLHVFAANPEAPLFEGEAQKVVAWTGEGEVVILPHHAPYAATLLPQRDIRVVTPQGEEVAFNVGDVPGVMSVKRNVVHILLG